MVRKNLALGWPKPTVSQTIFWSLVYLGSHAADLGFTVYSLNRGMGDEMNPLMLWALSHSLTAMICLKAGLTVITWAILAGLSHWLRFVWYAFRIITVLYLGLVIYHVIAGGYYLP